MSAGETPAKTKLSRLPESSWTNVQREAIARSHTRPSNGTSLLLSGGPLPGKPKNEWHEILLRQPGLLVTYAKFAQQLLYAGVVPEPLREIATLRIAWLCQASYEWAAHVPMAIAVGVRKDQVDQIPVGPSAELWDDTERLVLQAVDELHTGARIADATWLGLSERLTEAQLIELPFLVGSYQMLAFCLNSLDVYVDGMPLRSR